MVSKKAIICGVVGFLGALAFIFGIAGSFTGVKDGAYQFRYALDYSYCRWETTPATALGIVGCFLMLGAQVISNIAGGCVCCCVKQTLAPASKTTAILCLVISWILAMLASIFLLVGGIYNSGSVNMKLDAYTDGTLVCYYPATWPLIAGGVFSLFATGTAICFYVVASANGPPANDTIGQNNIQMPTANYKQSAVPAAAAVGVPPGGYQAGVPSPAYY